MSAEEKYIAIKIQYLKHWLWFQTEKTSEDGDTFRGWDGWGDGGAYTNIEISTSLIQGRIKTKFNVHLTKDIEGR